MSRIRAAFAYPIAYALVFAVMYARAPGYPLKNAWNDWRRR